MIRWGFENGSKIYDFGGVFILDKTNGLYKFKRGFCRREERPRFIGEFDLVYNPLLYTSFAKVLPMVQRRRNRIKHQQESVQPAPKQERINIAAGKNRQTHKGLSVCPWGEKVVKIAKFKSDSVDIQ